MFGFFIKDGSSLKKYIGFDKDVIIPSDVEHIYWEAFYCNERIQSVTISDSVYDIDADTFHRCNSLSEVILSESLTQIKNGTFSYCKNLEEITLPESLTKIGRKAFFQSSLTSVKIPEQVTEIEDQAFATDGTLDIVTVYSRQTSFGKDVFKGTDKLTIIAYRDSDAARYAADNGLICLYIEDISEVINHTQKNGSVSEPQEEQDEPVYRDDIFEIDGTRLVKCLKYEENIRIPDGITVIGKDVFAGHAWLRRVQLPNSLKIIEDGAFNRCTRLEEVDFPDSVERIGINAFRYCRSLKTLQLPKSLKHLDFGAFHLCLELTEVTFQRSNTEVELTAFSECRKLALVTIPETVQIKDNMMMTCFLGCAKEITFRCAYGSDGYFCAIRNHANIELTDSPRQQTGMLVENGVFRGYTGKDPEVILPAGVRHIAPEAFANNQYIVKVVIPDSVTTIGARAFYNCNSLYSVKLPAGLTRIEKETFKSCYDLEQITFPNGLTAIEADAFYFTDLMEVNLPDTLETIEENAFCNCSSLRAIRIPAATKELNRFTDPESSVTVFTTPNSTAAEYAKKLGLKVQYGDRIVRQPVSAVPSEKLPGNVRRTFYETLTNEEKKAYEITLYALLDMQPKCDLTGVYIHNKSWRAVWNALEQDYPQIFWVDWHKSVNPTNLSKSYSITKAEKDRMQSQIDAVAEPFLRRIPANLGDYEKAIKVYLWLTDLVEYDHSGLALQTNNQYDSVTSDDLRNIYGAFVKKKVVCVGYAMAFNYLLQALGIECVVRNGGGSIHNLHAWSMAKIEGSYYHIDATWGDMDIDYEPALRYSYFGLTDDDILRKHNSIDCLHSSILCDSFACNYYFKEGLYIERFDENEICRKIKQYIQRNGDTSVTLRFADQGSYEQAAAFIDKSKTIQILAQELDHFSVYCMKYPDFLVLCVRLL